MENIGNRLLGIPDGWDVVAHRPVEIGENYLKMHRNRVTGVGKCSFPIRHNKYIVRRKAK